MEELTKVKTEEKLGKMIVFASGKGGVGKTVLSVNTAVALAQKGYSTCIVDGDFQFGDVNLAFDLQPKLTISDLVQDIKSLTSSMLPNYLQNHESGVKVLSAPLKPEYADLITASSIKDIIQKLLELHEYVVADISSGLTENNITFMEQADKILVVTDLEMAALKNTKTMLKTLKVLNMTEKVSVLVNRGNMESVIKFKDVPGILELRDLFYISNDFKVVSKSFNIGIPFIISKPNEKITREVNYMVDKICNRRYSARGKRKKKKSFLDFLKRK